MGCGIASSSITCVIGGGLVAKSCPILATPGTGVCHVPLSIRVPEKVPRDRKKKFEEIMIFLPI